MGETVFVTVGTTRFDALVAVVVSEGVCSTLASMGVSKLILQVGKSEIPARLGRQQNDENGSCKLGEVEVEWFRFAPGLDTYMSNSQYIISHAGSGSLFESLRLRKRVVAVVNDALMHNHQAELAEQLAREHAILCTVPSELQKTLQSADWTRIVPLGPGNSHRVVQGIDDLLGVRS